MGTPENEGTIEFSQKFLYLESRSVLVLKKAQWNKSFGLETNDFSLFATLAQSQIKR